MSRRFCFTINNYTEEELACLANVSGCKYLIAGKEIGNSGTPHIQGFVIFDNSVSALTAKNRICARAHIEVARGTSDQAAEYCKKDGDFVEYGVFPRQQGKRSDWDEYRQWIEELGRIPTGRELVVRFPSLYARYKRACFDYAEALLPHPVLTSDEPRDGWQAGLRGIIDEDPSDRLIHFYVDHEGNSGKSWMCRYLLTNFPDRVQVMRIGKRDDLSYAIDPSRDIFLFDVPRNQMVYLQYSVLEGLKDRMIFSPKYESSLKILRKVPHVVVFSNEEPDLSSLSADRFDIYNI